MSASVVVECGARHDTGLVGEFVCNRPEEHEGDHEAHWQRPDGRWEAVAHWSNGRALCVHRPEMLEGQPLR